MPVTATEAKNRFGQVLDDAQREPVVIEKAGRPHSVVMSMALYEELRAAAARRARSARGEAFYAQHRDWFDAQNELVERHGIPGEEHRPW